MASAVQTAQHSYPTPSYSRNSTGSSTGPQNSLQGDINSFSGLQSLASTPTQTPPPSRGHQHPMSYTSSAYGQSNGMYMQQGGPGGYGELNGNISHQQYPMGQKPQIYTVGCLRLISLDKGFYLFALNVILTRVPSLGCLLWCLRLRDGGEPHSCDAPPP